MRQGKIPVHETDRRLQVSRVRRDTRNPDGISEDHLVRLGLLVRIEMFDLYKVGNDGWMKNIYGDESDNVDFKCVNAEIFHQIVKHYFGKPITENDLVFYHNGQLAKFMKEVDNPW